MAPYPTFCRALKTIIMPNFMVLTESEQLKHLSAILVYFFKFGAKFAVNTTGSELAHTFNCWPEPCGKPIPERLAALESWILAENFDTKHGIPYAVSLEKFCSERVRDLGKDVDIVGRTLLFLFARFNTFFVLFAKEEGRIKQFQTLGMRLNISLLTSYFGLGSRTGLSLWVSTPASEEPSTGTQVSVFNCRDFCIFASHCKA